ncbi:hypothetical protein [Pyrobaculum ferrireducens]|uniref:Uncharacterized protein n=1 Tax=Pyrobaculum ferrireducens TaxID=1104324 RepID=G7VC11_9CREN|nr:hypothetical protein [Pyrobaculum ferrireducens]AET32511.1 hypothetical protein P186_1075 [Pyrobaculum ferrireducens]
MLLVVVKSDSEEVVKRARRAVGGLELLPGLYLTWTPRERLAKAVEALKREIIKRWDAEGRGPTLEVAVLPLTEEQYRELRPMARAVIEEAAESLLAEMDRLLEAMRSGKRRGEGLLGWYRDVASRYQKLVDASVALDIEPTVMGRLREKWKEVSLEAGRLR